MPRLLVYTFLNRGNKFQFPRKHGHQSSILCTYVFLNLFIYYALLLCACCTLANRWLHCAAKAFQDMCQGEACKHRFPSCIVNMQFKQQRFRNMHFACLKFVFFLAIILRRLNAETESGSIY